jgi:hypothetical protein
MVKRDCQTRGMFVKCAIVNRRKWACGAVGSALPWHGRGREFESHQVHQNIPALRQFRGQPRSQDHSLSTEHLHSLPVVFEVAEPGMYDLVAGPEPADVIPTPVPEEILYDTGVPGIVNGTPRLGDYGMVLSTTWSQTARAREANSSAAPRETHGRAYGV